MTEHLGSIGWVYCLYHQVHESLGKQNLWVLHPLYFTCHWVLFDWVFPEFEGIQTWPRDKGGWQSLVKEHMSRQLLSTAMPPYTEASRLLCTAADNSCWFCTAAWAGVTKFCGSWLVANIADVPTWGTLLTPFWASLSSSSDVFHG